MPTANPFSPDQEALDQAERVQPHEVRGVDQRAPRRVLPEVVDAGQLGAAPYGVAQRRFRVPPAIPRAPRASYQAVK
jgi:hypothetical protein